jgi:hypothetical protein
MEDWGSYILPAARAAWGEPSSEGEIEVRFGAHGSKAIRLDKGVWHDHETGESGGVVDLVRTHLIPVGEREAHGAVARYLHKEFGAPLDDTAAPVEDMSVFKPGMKLVETYWYANEHGEKHLRVERHEDGNGDKTFRQYTARNLAPSKDSAYYAVPYRLDSILAAPNKLVFIAEGEKCVHALEQLGLLATCNPGGAKNWHVNLGKWLDGRRVVVLPDNDQAGSDHADDVIEKLKPWASEIRRVELPGLEHKGDAADWVAAGGTKEQLIELVQSAACIDLGEIDTRYKYADLVDILEREPAHWLIPGYLPASSLAAVFGAPGSYKSFLCLDMLLSLAHGTWFAGHKLQQGYVCYVAGEGGGALRKRIGAWHQHRGIEPQRGVFGIIEEPVPLSEEGAIEALIADLEAMRRRKPLRAICFDTLARCMSGDENSATDMGEAIRALDAVKAHFAPDVSVIAVHHAGKNEDRGLRGSSALLGALDTALQCKRQDTQLQVITEKMKDFEPSEPAWFRGEKVYYQRHILDDAESSIVLELMDDAPKVEQKLTPAQKEAMKALHEAMLESGAHNINGIERRSVSLEQWWRMADGFQISTGNDASRRRAWKRAVEGLHQIGRVGVRNKRTWPNAENQAIGQAPDTKTDKVDWG